MKKIVDMTNEEYVIHSTIEKLDKVLDMMDFETSPEAFIELSYVIFELQRELKPEAKYCIFD